jgi:hypothetical protein
MITFLRACGGLLAASALLGAGCKKQADQTAFTGANSAANQDSSAATNASLPALPSTATPAEVDTAPTLESANQSMQIRDYVGASLALVKMDTKTLSPEDVSKRAAAMRALQKNVAEAAAAGDTRALEAAKILRATSER